MKKIGELLDIRSLQMFVAAMESHTLTEAAEKLAVKQSTISHALDKLRAVFNDPLLVRSGRSVKPTNRAIELLPKVKAILAELETLTDTPIFHPEQETINYTIAANDFQSRLLLPQLYQQLNSHVKQLQLTVIPSWLPDSGTLRDERIDMAISPQVPQSGDIMQRKLFDFQEVCFYDPSQRQAPKTVADFIDANYICPQFLLDYEAIDLAPSQKNSVWLQDKTQIITNTFADLAYFLRGTQALAIAPIHLANQSLQGFSYVPFPYISPSSMYLIWNKRFQKDPKHRWFREQLANIAEQLTNTSSKDCAEAKKSTPTLSLSNR